MRFLLLVIMVLASACGVLGMEPTKEEKGDMEKSQFAELMARPDIEVASKRYEEMRAKVRGKLVDESYVISWQERADSAGGGGCSRSYPEVRDGAQWGLKRWTAEGNLPDEKWERAVTTVAEVAREYGFGEPKSVVNRPSDHEVSFKDGYGAEMLFGTAVNTILTLSTGCHLTVAAHQRGTPTPRPTY